MISHTGTSFQRMERRFSTLPKRALRLKLNISLLRQGRRSNNARALSAIALDQLSPTKMTYEKTLFFLDYVASHPAAILTFKKSNRFLAVHSDASYLTEPKSRSRTAGHFYMTDGAEEEDLANSPGHNIAQVIRNVMTLADDAKIGALFVNSRFAIPTRQLLEEMGHPQPPTPIQTDNTNTTALGFLTKNCNQKPLNLRK